MKRLLPGVLLLFLYGACVVSAAEPLSPLPFTRIDTSPKPHAIPIAAPLAGGPLRILFIGQRETVGFSWSEIASRLDCASESVLTESRGELSPVTMPASPDSILLSSRSVTGRVSGLLERPWDVIWLDLDLRTLPDTVRSKLLERVASGAGLVYVGKASDLDGIGRQGKFDRDMFRGISFPGYTPKYAGERGKGIILSIPEFDRRSLPRETGDYFTGAVHAIMLASGRFRGFGTIGIQDPGRDIEHESMNIMNYRVDFRNQGHGARHTVHVRYRDESGRVIHESEDAYDMPKGRGFFRVTYPMFPLGVYSADISIMEDGKVIALAGKTFRVHSEDMLEGIALRNSLASPGEFLTGRVRMSQEMEEGMVLVLEIFDHSQRLIARSEIVPETRRKWEDFAFKATEEMKGMMRLRASLYKNNKLIHALTAPAFVRGGDKARRFSLIVGETSVDEPWLLNGYEQLVGAGVNMFALDMKDATPSEAGRAALNVFRAGGTPVPVFASGTGAETLAVAETLLGMPVSRCWVRDATGGRNRTGMLAEYLDSARKGDATPALLSELSAETFFNHEWKYDPFELRIAPWRNLFGGIGAVCWTGASGNVGDALLPGGGLNPAFAVMAGECRTIMGGADLLLSGAQRDEGAAVRLIPERSGAKAFLFRDGDVRYVGILPEYGSDAESAGIRSVAKIGDFSRPMYLYDVRAGNYRGQATEIAFTMNNEAELFALLPYRVKDVDIRFSGGVVRAGGKLDFVAEIVPQETGETPERHVLGIALYGPDGKERSWLRSEREAPGGKVQVSFQLPASEPQGKWVLQVRDVLSGKKTERPFIIMPSGEVAGG